MTLEELEKKLTEIDDLRAELDAQIAELKAQLDELKNAQIEDAPPHPRWKAEYGEKYFVISDRVTAFYAGNCDFDNTMHDIGNDFQTKEDAEFMLERLKVLTKMREWAGDWNAPYVLVYGRAVGCIMAVENYCYNGAIRFRLKQDAKNCLKAVGEDRLKKYYFMIPEEEV